MPRDYNGSWPVRTAKLSTVNWHSKQPPCVRNSDVSNMYVYGIGTPVMVAVGGLVEFMAEETLQNQNQSTRLKTKQTLNIEY